ncbi:MAG: NAD-dependent epimerase/dehydratase family protein [Reichenbachiella sp.]|uniref:NAD-dependent epimerase/dehydratase family protein n=1 Tax=Reichenbachiella sp. TaxID=2184521 RepID=UPI00329A05A3
MGLKVIITGATGMVGKGVLLECLDHPDIDEVLSISRSNLNLTHPKLKELIHADFLDYSKVKDQLTDYDACYLCMGVSAGGLSKEKYTELTYDYTLTLAKILLELNPSMTCTYVSGEGTDSTEKGRSMWARVKGKTENDLLNLGFKQAHMFRPGAIIPLRSIKSKTKAYQFMYDYFMWLVKFIKLVAPNSVVNTTQIGLAMINVTKNGCNKKIIRPKDILELAQLKDI